MDISPIRRKLSLALAALICVPIIGCTETVYARSRLSSTNKKYFSLTEIEEVLIVGDWRKFETVYRLDRQSSLYLRVDEHPPKTFVFSLVAVGTKKFEPAEMKIYRELVDAMLKRFGDAFEYDKTSSAGQALFKD